MKKFVLLITILLASWTVSLGQSTKSTTTNKDSISLPNAVGRAVAADLLRGDSMRSELIIKNDIIALQKRNLDLKDSIITSNKQIIEVYKLKEQNYIKIDDYRTIQLNNQTNTIKGLGKQVRNLKTKNIVTTSVLGGAIIYLGIELIKSKAKH